MYNDIVTTVGKGNGSSLVLLDLSTAFDTIDHDNLFYILEEYGGIGGRALRLIRSYPSVIRKYGKCQTNNNRQQLIEICSKNELYITNTFFDHKMAHRTTWICPERVKIIKTKMETSERTRTETNRLHNDNNTIQDLGNRL